MIFIPRSPQIIPLSLVLASSLRSPTRLTYLQETTHISPWLQGSPPSHKSCLAQLREGATRQRSPKNQASWQNLASRPLTLRSLQKRRKRELSEPSEILRREKRSSQGVAASRVEPNCYAYFAKEGGSGNYVDWSVILVVARLPLLGRTIRSCRFEYRVYPLNPNCAVFIVVMMGLSSLIIPPWSCLLVVTTIVSSMALLGNADAQFSLIVPSPLTNAEFQQQCPFNYSSGKAAQVTEWHPWTQKPVCVGPKSNKTLQHCAFIKEDFRGNKALLIITSPEVAIGDVSLVESIGSQRANIQPSLETADPLPFEVETIPGKGLGAVANTHIRAGDVIFREYPMIMQLAQVPASISWMQALWVLEEGFILLPREDQQRVFDLSRSTGGHVLEDIIRTNTFGASFNNAAHLGLFPNVAVGDYLLASCSSFTDIQ